MKKLISIGAFALMCYAGAVQDSDLDGVPDNLDMCPNTPFLETVNKYGCSEAQLKNLKKNKIKFDFSAGYEYDNYKSYNSSNTLFTSLSAAKDKLKASLFFSELDDGSGVGYKSNDLILSLYYYLFLKNVSFKFGSKVYFPTEYNSKTDYALLAKGTYYFKDFSIGLSEKHKIYGEAGANAKDTVTLELDTSYKKLYISPYVYTENSAYNSNRWYKYAGISLFYLLNKKFSISIDSSIDLEENQNYTITSSIGYSF